MNSRNHIQRELELYNSSLPSDVRMPVFDLPQGYFENFAAEVLARIKGETAATASEEIESLSPLLAGLSRKTPFSLPPDYFSRNLLSGTQTEADPVPAWQVQGRSQTYRVPTGYFDQLAAQVLQQVRPQAKVVSMASRRWMQYAAAAVLTGAMVLGGILYQQKTGSADPAGSPVDWVANKLDQVSNQELDAFILSTEMSSDAMAQQKGNSKELRTLLKDVSSSELDAFLNQVPAETELIN